MEKIIWHYTSSTEANKNNLSESQIQNIFTCFNKDYYKKFKKDSLNVSLDKYSMYTDTIYQLKKCDEIEHLWFENLTYEINNEYVVSNVKFDIEFPSDFEIDDIYQWCENFNRLTKSYIMYNMDRLINGETDIDDKELIFVKELENNQKTKINN